MAPRAATALDGRWLHFWYTTPMAEGAGCASGTSYGGGGGGGGGADGELWWGVEVAVVGELGG